MSAPGTHTPLPWAACCGIWKPLWGLAISCVVVPCQIAWGGCPLSAFSLWVAGKPGKTIWERSSLVGLAWNHFPRAAVVAQLTLITASVYAARTYWSWLIEKWR